jgi:hypothetical protein
MLHTIGETDIFTNSCIRFIMNPFVHNTLDRHIFQYVLDRSIKRYHIFIILNKLTFFIENCLLLQIQLFIKAYAFNVILKNRNKI